MSLGQLVEEKGPSISQLMSQNILKGTKDFKEFNSTFSIQRGLTHI